MRIQPIPPDRLTADIRFVHDEIANLIGRTQSQVKMIDDKGALLGPFIAMLQYPQFGVPALSFLRTLDTHATLSKTVREVAILTVGGFYGSKFIPEVLDKVGEIAIRSAAHPLAHNPAPEQIRQPEHRLKSNP